MKLSYIIVAGGYEHSNSSPDGSAATPSVEAFTGELAKKQLPDLPEDFICCSVFMHNGIILCQGFWKTGEYTCFQLDIGTWKESGNLNVQPRCASTVTTKTATFAFGGEVFCQNTYEYLPIGSNSWLLGKTEIPGGYSNGCAIAVKSEQEIWLIGGSGTEKRILSFDVNNHTFKELPFQLNVERRGHRAALIPNSNKIMIIGGFNDNDNRLKSTEVHDPETGSHHGKSNEH